MPIPKRKPPTTRELTRSISPVVVAESDAPGDGFDEDSLNDSEGDETDEPGDGNAAHDLDELTPAWQLELTGDSLKPTGSNRAVEAVLRGCLTFSSLRNS